MRAPGLFCPSKLPDSKPACPRGPADSARNASFMLDAGWPALLLLAALCFLLTTKISDPLFGGVVGALQALARAAGYLALRTPRDAFLAALANTTFPPRVVALDEPPLAPRSAVSSRGSR